MLLVPCGQRKWQIGKVPQSVGKAFEVSMLALIPHCPMPHQRTVPENNVYRIGLNTVSSNTVVKKISVAQLVSISTGEFFDIFSMFSCLLVYSFICRHSSILIVSLVHLQNWSVSTLICSYLKTNGLTVVSILACAP